MTSIYDWAQSKGIKNQGITLDGLIHRHAEDPKKPHKKDLWSIGTAVEIRNGQTVIYGAAGDWRTGEKVKFKPNIRLTKKEQKSVKKVIQQLQQAEDHALKERQAEAAKKSEELIATMSSDPTLYITKKGIRMFGVGSIRDQLIVPLRNRHGQLTGVQKINADGSKRFITGTKVSESFHIIGNREEISKKAFLAEGYATASSIHMATFVPTIVCFNAGNLCSVARIIRDLYPDATIIIAGDDDQNTAGNPGRTNAIRAAKDVNGIAVFPTFTTSEGKANKWTDFNDVHCSQGLEAVKLQLNEAEIAEAQKIDAAWKSIQLFCGIVRSEPTKKLTDSELDALIEIERENQPLFQRALKELRKIGFLKNHIEELLSKQKTQRSRTNLDSQHNVSNVDDLPDMEAIDTDSSDKNEVLADLYLESRRYKQGDILLLRCWNDNWYLYNSKHYQLIPDFDLGADVSKWLLEEQEEEVAGTRLRNNLLADIQGRTLIPHDIKIDSWFDLSQPNDRRYINLQNGILDLDLVLHSKPDALLNHSPQYFTLTILPFEYDAKAECQRWQSFLEEVLPKLDVRQSLQEWFGYNLTLDTKYHKFMVLFGKGANGKSVILTVLLTLLGKENVSTVGLEQFSYDRTFPMAEMNGKRANIVEEVSRSGFKSSVTILKKLVAGNEIQVERKHKHPFMMTPTAKITVNTNEMPKFDDASDGLSRRLMIIVFNVQILDELKQDKRLVTSKYWLSVGEMPGIFNWALKGLIDLETRGAFTESEESKLIKENLKTLDEFPVVFLREQFNYQEGARIDSKRLYDMYVSANREENEGVEALKARDFAKVVKQTFPGVVQTQHPLRQYGYRSRNWVNLSLVTRSGTDGTKTTSSSTIEDSSEGTTCY